jgi:glycosyltransferase involved in cell wall biosynthesis
LDDASSDGTDAFVKTLKDPRIRYYKNEENMGSRYGDWWAIRKVVYELMRGQYFIYLCDDDRWKTPYVLETLIDKFEKYPNLSLAFGMHSHAYAFKKFLNPLDSLVLDIKNCYTTRKMFPEGYMTGAEYLEIFSSNPCGKNYLEGASLFSREKMIESGAFSGTKGTKWQAGYMFKMGPAVVGDVYFIDEPYVLANVDISAQSYSRTQKDHFWDIVDSINDSHKWVIKSDTFSHYLKVEKKKINFFYRRAFNNFIVNWYKHQSAWKGGLDFPGTPDAYFEDQLTLKDFYQAALKAKFWPSLKSICFVALGVLPKFLVRIIWICLHSLRSLLLSIRSWLRYFLRFIRKVFK